MQSTRVLLEKMITFNFFEFDFCSICLLYSKCACQWWILNITSPEQFIFTCISVSRLFELFSNDVCVNKKPGMYLMWMDKKNTILKAILTDARGRYLSYNSLLLK